MDSEPVSLSVEVYRYTKGAKAWTKKSLLDLVRTSVATSIAGGPAMVEPTGIVVTPSYVIMVGLKGFNPGGGGPAGWAPSISMGLATVVETHSEWGTPVGWCFLVETWVRAIIPHPNETPEDTKERAYENDGEDAITIVGEVRDGMRATPFQRTFVLEGMASGRTIFREEEAIFTNPPRFEFFARLDQQRRDEEIRRN